MARPTAAGIRASTLITEAFDLAAPETWEVTRAAHRAAIDLMARRCSHWIYFTPGGTTGDPWREDAARLAQPVGRPSPRRDVRRHQRARYDW